MFGGGQCRWRCGLQLQTMDRPPARRAPAGRAWSGLLVRVVGVDRGLPASGCRRFPDPGLLGADTTDQAPTTKATAPTPRGVAGCPGCEQEQRVDEAAAAIGAQQPSAARQQRVEGDDLLAPAQGDDLEPDGDLNAAGQREQGATPHQSPCRSSPAHALIAHRLGVCVSGVVLGRAGARMARPTPARRRSGMRIRPRSRRRPAPRRARRRRGAGTEAPRPMPR